MNEPLRRSLDPRPDLERDSALWDIALRTALPRPTLYGLLHGLRCGGATLKRTTTSDGKPFLKLDFRPLLTIWEEQRLVEDWLLPYRSHLVHLFLEAARKKPPPAFVQPKLFAYGKDVHR